MTQPGHESERPAPTNPSVDTHGAVDLSGLASGSPSGGTQPGAAQAGAGSGAGTGASGGADSWVLAVQPQQLQEIVQLSGQVPVLLVIHDAAPASQSMRATLADAVDAQQGRVLMAELDAASHPEIAQQSQGQLPVATAFLGGQPVGEFDAQISEEQLRQLVEQMVQMATQNGMTQRMPAQSRRAGGAEQTEEEPQLPPLHQKAHDALESGDYDGAVAAYEEALRENPGDSEAEIGRAQVQLMRRTRDADLETVRTAAAEAPDDVEAQIAVADVDVLGGHVEDALARLVAYVRDHHGEDRERARAHLVELYSIVGDTDPRVNRSRQQLARALF
ncbi:MAG: tetratricopeptide repeat protein [Nesterenkonia sp.]|nr:tetratricopeptide repeat protein [Nesterenkonia sp.]